MNLEDRKRYLLMVVAEMENAPLSLTDEILLAGRKVLFLMDIAEEDLRRHAEELLMTCKKYFKTVNDTQ